jgi:hypothetical protein
MTHYPDLMEKVCAELTAKGRDRIKAGNFALSGRRYPIFDRAHAANARARVMQHGTPAEQQRVFQATARKYPTLGKE